MLMVSARLSLEPLKSLPMGTSACRSAGARSPHAIMTATLVLCLSGVASVAAPSGPMADDYLAAAQLLPANLEGLVRNETVVPHWVGSAGAFWYQRDGE